MFLLTRPYFACSATVVMVAAILGDVGLVSTAIAAGERFTVAPIRAAYNATETVDFAGQLLDSRNRPLANVQIGVEDPIQEMSLIAARTDNAGCFVFRVPGVKNSKAGSFKFRFVANVGAKPSQFAQVAVNPVPGRFRQFAEASNPGKDRYQVDLVVDGVAKGRQIFGPGQSGYLWDVTDGKSHKLELVCTNLKNGKTFIVKPSSTGVTADVPAVCAVGNPTNSRFGVSVGNSVTNGVNKRETRNFTAAAPSLYETTINKQWGLGANVSVGTTTKQGINFEAGVSGGATCSTFLGVQAICSVGCEASVGLQLKFCLGACFPIEPVAALGCGWSCGISFANASCGVSADVSAKASYK